MMNLLAMSGNIQSLDRLFSRADAGSQVAGAAGSGSDFASSIKQSQVEVSKQSGGKGEKDFSTEAVESPSVRGTDNSPCEHGAKETPKVVNTVGKRGSEGILSDKSAKQGSLLSPDDSISGEADKQAEKAGVPADTMHSYVAVMAMLNGLVLEDGTSTPESGIFLLSQSAAVAPVALESSKPQAGEQLSIEQLVQQVLDRVAPNGGVETASEVAALIGSVIHGGGDEQTGINVSSMTVAAPVVLGSSEPQAGKQLPMEQLLQQVMDNVTSNTGVETASEVAALIGSVIHGGGDEQTGINVSSMTVAAPVVLGSSEPQAGKQLPIEQLLQQLRDSASGNSGGKSASELAALIGSVINGSGDEVVGTNGSAPVPENGNLISGFMNVVKNGDNGQNNVGGKNQTEVASLISNSRLESLAAKVSAGKNIVAAEQAAVAVTHTSKQQPGNLFSGNEASRSALKTMADQLLVGTGEKMKSAVDQQPHDKIQTSLGDAPGQKNAAEKMIFSQSQGTLEQQASGQKSQADATLSLGLSELSSVKRDNARIVANATGENQFSGLPLPGLESAAGKGENPLPVTSDDLLNQVTMRLPDRHSSRQVVTIQLQPESLGKVEIKLVMEQQKLTAHFVVQHSDVRDVLLKHVTSLHDALVAKGVEVKHVAVEVAPAEKMTGMAVTVDQHPAGGNQSGNFQQFSSGSEQRQHAFATQDEILVQPLKSGEVPVSPILSKLRMFAAPGSLHIQA